MGEVRPGFAPMSQPAHVMWCQKLAVILLGASSLCTPWLAHAQDVAPESALSGQPSAADIAPSHLPAFPLPEEAPPAALPAIEAAGADAATPLAATTAVAEEEVKPAPKRGFWDVLMEDAAPAEVPAEAATASAPEAATPPATEEKGMWQGIKAMFAAEDASASAEAVSAEAPAETVAQSPQPLVSPQPAPIAPEPALPAVLPDPAPAPVATQEPVKLPPVPAAPSALPFGAAGGAVPTLERFHAGSAVLGGQGNDFMRSIAGSDGVISLDVTRAIAPADIMEPIRIDEAVAFALKNNFEAQASKSKLKSAYWEKMAAYSQYVPALDWKYSAGQETSMPSSYNDIYGNRVMNDKHVRRDAVFSVRQPLIDLSMIAEILNTANKESLAEQEDRDAREGIAYDTVSVYLRLIQARIAVQLADQYRGYLDDLSARMEARVAGGGATAGDFERIKGRSTQAEAARIEAVGDYETNLAEFQRLTQITPAQLEIPGILSPKVPADVTEALERALIDNAAYRASLLKTKVAESSRDKAYAKTAPKVSLEYSDTYAYNAGGAANGNPVDGVYPDQEDKRLMVVAHWTLNGGLELMEGVTGAEKLREARYRSMDAKSRIEQGLRTSYNAIHAAEQRIEVLQQGVDANSKVVAEFEDQYKNGSRSIFELLDAHEQLYASRLNLMRLAIAKAQASYQVRRQMGDLLAVLLEQPTR